MDGLQKVNEFMDSKQIIVKDVSIWLQDIDTDKWLRAVRCLSIIVQILYILEMSQKFRLNY